MFLSNLKFKEFRSALQRRNLILILGSLFFEATVWAVTPQFIVSNVNRSEIYSETLGFANSGVQEAIVDGFTKLFEENLITGFYRLSSISFPRGNFLFSQLNHISSIAPKKCHALLCKDLQLRNKLNEELLAGRLVIVTNSFQRFNAAVVDDNSDLTDFKKQLNVADPNKRLLIITPRTELAHIVHELTHAKDFESETLEKLRKLGKELIQHDKISSKNFRRIFTFCLEIRAYDIQMEFIKNNARPVEFSANIDQGIPPYDILIEEMGTQSYIEAQRKIIDEKVRDYLSDFLVGLKDEKLTSESRSALLKITQELLPSIGIYSYIQLVQPILIANEF